MDIIPSFVPIGIGVNICDQVYAYDLLRGSLIMQQTYHIQCFITMDILIRKRKSILLLHLVAYNT